MSKDIMNRFNETPVTYDVLLGRFRALLRLCGVERVEEFGLHSLRRGIALDMLAANVPARDIFHACG